MFSFVLQRFLFGLVKQIVVQFYSIHSFKMLFDTPCQLNVNTIFRDIDNIGCTDAVSGEKENDVAMETVGDDDRFIFNFQSY